MIVRTWLIAGILLVGLAWYLMVPLSPAPFQASRPTEIDGYRAQGLIPAAGELVLSGEIGHEVFEIPLTDRRHAKEEAATEMSGMPGMEAAQHPGEMAGMPGMEAAPVPAEHPAEMPGMPGMEAAPPAQHPGEMAGMPGMEAAPPTPEHPGEMAGMPGMETAPPPAERPGGMAGMPEMEAAPPPAQEPGEMTGMPGMEAAPPATEQAGEMAGMPGMEAAAPAAEGAMPGMEMPGMEMAEEEEGHGGMAAGMTVLAQGSAAEVEAALGTIEVDRVIDIKMSEWGFDPEEIMVEPGEVLRIKVDNTGDIPHEFMFMPMSGMQAVAYRLERADWNLAEHEAISEQPIVLPGEGFEQVVRIERPGMWMYMCMLPYHMQFGMMGRVLTEGASMGGMKM